MDVDTPILQRIERIEHRRRQVLAHSTLYYRFNANIIDDATYDRWCLELAELQAHHPEAAKQGVYAEYFADFDGSTGYHLPITLPEVVGVATFLVEQHRRRRK